MFDQLTQSLQSTFKSLRGQGKLTEENIQQALRDVRMALLEADVHYQVVKSFVGNVREKVMGADVLNAVSPGQQFIKHVHDEMERLLGDDKADFEQGPPPQSIVMLGLHGVGKTTTTGKLARRFRSEKKKVLVVGCDIRRPAAVDQLRVLAGEADVEMLGPVPGESVAALGRRARQQAEATGMDVVIYDTGGRLQIDDDLVQEVAELTQVTNARNKVLVLDAAMGQESVSVAETFNDRCGLTGLILTKLDGDARGGAALSVREVTGCPILMIGTGEKQEDLQPFYPDRMANRILGMGDVVGLVEKAQQTVDEEDMERMQKRMFSGKMNLEDFLTQIQQMKKLGSMSQIMDMVPGMPGMDAAKKAKAAEMGQRQSKKFEAIIQSMTLRERRNPKLINGKRRIRIAKGSGTRVKDVNDLLKQFAQTQKMTKRMKKFKGKMPGLPSGMMPRM
jgi:signal recognition particle subunit SRP54